MINGKKYLEHRYIMQQHIGRELTKTEVVHHIDGNKHNNDIENLELNNSKEHLKYHAQIKSLTTERIKIKCPECNKYIIISKKYYYWKKKNGQKNFYCSNICKGLSANLPHNINPEIMDIILNEYMNGKTGYAISKEYGFLNKTVYNYINRFKMLL